MYVEAILNIGNLNNNLLINKNLEVFKYLLKKNKNKATKKGRIKEIDFTTNKLKIAYATARTICSYHIDNKELFLDFISSLTGQINLVKDEEHFDYLLLSADRLTRLRDFSQKTRIGEIAQAINYLFVQERLEYPYIIDYHLFCERMSINVNGVSPDFVILNKDLTKIGLFESKGEAAKADGVTTKLNEAIEQLEFAKHKLHLSKNIYANSLYPTCTKFQFAKPSKSSINYLKISMDENEDINPIEIYKRHYASFFYLVGDFNRAIALDKGNKIEELDTNKYFLEEETDIYWVSRILSPEILDQISFVVGFEFLSNKRIKIGIRKINIQPLLTDNFSIIPDVQETSTDRNLIWFKDGTIIKIEKD